MKMIAVSRGNVMATRTHSTEQESSHSEHKATNNQSNWGIIGVVTMALIALVGFTVVGRVTDATYAQTVIEAMSPPMQMLAFATITATVTVLVLTLTMLSVMKELERSFSKQFYSLIERIGFLAASGLILGIFLLALLSIPFHDAQTAIADQASIVVYYLLVFTNALISGLLVALILMLFDSVKSVIRISKVQEDEEN
jgi:uncharacterized protein YacL